MPAYGKLCTEFYDLDKPSPPAGALAYDLDRARRAGGRVLEPMCGSGRFLLPMVVAGIEADGVDDSPAMVAACRARAQRLGVAVDVHEQSLASLALPHRYALAFIPSGSIGLIADEGALVQALSRLRAHLAPEGRLLLEIVVDDGAPTAATEPAPRVVTGADGSTITYTCVASRMADGALQHVAGRYTRRVGRRVVATETEQPTLRLYAPHQMKAALAACGFTPLEASVGAAPAFLARGGCTLVEAIAAGDPPSSPR